STLSLKIWKERKACTPCGSESICKRPRSSRARWTTWPRRYASSCTEGSGYGKTASPSSWIERKEMAHKLDIIKHSLLTERALQVHRRYMEELFHQAHAERLESTTLALFEWAHPG